MQIATYRSARDNRPEPTEATWPELARSLLEHLRRPDKDGPAWSPAEYDPGATRSNRNVRAVTACVFDLDHVDLDDDDWLIELERAGLDGVIHSTHSHTEEHPKLRLVLPVSRPMSPDEWRRLGPHVIDLLELPADRTVGDPARLYYAPSAPEGAEVIAHRLPGERVLDVDSALQSAPEQIPSKSETTAGDSSPGEVGEGGRNHALTSLGGTMRHFGFGAEAIEAALLAENEIRCSPPLPADEVRQIAQSVGRYKPEADPSAGQLMAEALGVGQTERQGLHQLAEVVAEQDRPPIRSYSTGHPELDALLNGGFATRQLASVLGPPGAGKTAWAIDVMLHVAKQIPVLYVSTELESHEVVARLAAPVLDCPWTEIVRGRVDKRRVADAVAGLPISIIGCDVLERGVEGLKAIVTSAEEIADASDHPPLVVIDFLQDLLPPGEDNVRGRVGEYASTFRAMSQELDCPVVAINSVGRGYYGAARAEVLRQSEDATVYLAAAKESGGVDYASASVLFLDVDAVAEDDGSKLARIAVAKARHGMTGFVGARFWGGSGRWEPDRSAVDLMSAEGRADRHNAERNEADEQRVLDKIRELAERPKDDAGRSGLMSKTDLKRNLGGQTARKQAAIDRLLERGVIEARWEEYIDPITCSPKQRAVVDLRIRDGPE